MREDELTRVLGNGIKDALKEKEITFEKLQEIRLRIGKPLIIVCDNKEWVLQKKIEREDLLETLEYVSNYSLYAYENELRQGFITIEGGHRVGMAGQVLMEQGKVKNLKQVSSLNIRVSHEIMNCADSVLPYITYNKKIYHTLIISPPRCGKTTLLRDLIRQVSEGNKWVKGCNVGVVDERSELAACYKGIPQNHVGMRTDVLDGCPKAEGMLMLIRSMSPQVIAVDEIGALEEIQAMKYAMHCGCKLLATVHGESMEEIQKKPLFEQMIKEHCFERYVILENRNSIGEIREIYDERGSLIYKDVEACISG